MRVNISGMAWLRKSELAPHQLKNLREQLTIQPRKTTDIAAAEDPEPILLYQEDEARGFFGVPRAFYLERQTLMHDEVVDVSLGEPMRELGTLWRPDGPYKEQGDVVRFLESKMADQPWGGFILKAGCGFGKSITSIELARRFGRRTLILVHKEFFLKQWTKLIKKMMPDARVGLIRQDRCDYDDCDFVIGMIQSLAKDDYGKKYPREIYRSSFGMVITDECFVGGTMVETASGPRRIDEVQEGDSVLSAVGHGMVKNAGSRLIDVSELRIIRFADGSEEICSVEHPFFTKSGWVKAANLRGESVLTFDDSIGIMRRHEKTIMSDVRQAELSEGREEVLLKGMHGPVEAQSSGALRVLRRGGDEAEKDEVLFDILSAEVDVGELRSFYEEALRRCEGLAQTEPAGESRGFGAHDGEQSDALCCDSAEGVGQTCGDRAPSPCEGRERYGDVASSVDVAVRAGGWVGVGSCGEDVGEARESAEVSDELQGGYCEQGEDGAKREDLERHGVSLDGNRVRVYNLAVSGHPSYILHSNGGVVHNCHRIGASTWAAVLPRFSAAWRVGLTATDRRKDGAQNVFFYHIGPVAYRARTAAMIPQLRTVYTGALSSPIDRGSYHVDSHRLTTQQILSQLVGNEFRNRAIADDIVEAVRNGRKIMVVSERLEHLRRISWQINNMMMDIDFEYEGRPFIPVVDCYTGEWYSGERKKGGKPKMVKRSEADLARAERANVILATKQMVEEGLDIQALDVLELVSPLSDIEQVVGRVRRWCEPEPKKCEHFCPWRAGVCKGKPQPIVTDYVDERIPQAARRWKTRQRHYKEIGCG